jgi:hypothetical protein
MFSSRKSSAPAAGGYNLTKSLRFRSSASAYLNRTPASAGNRTTWTLSFWCKRGLFGGDKIVLSAGTTGSTDVDIFFPSDQFMISDRSGWQLKTTQVFRDPSAWYHFVVAFDTTQATSTNRIKMYVNGSQITDFSGPSYPAQNATSSISNNVPQYIGTRSIIDNLYDGYLAEVNFIGGQALTPSSFGETSTTTGVWIPKKYTGSYGTNGFYLPFTDTTSTSTLGTDFSGNSNTWTVNNISLTSGSTYDSMNDVPTLTSATTANYCVINAVEPSSLSVSNGNLKCTYSGSDTYYTRRGTIGVSSGKYYFEYYCDAINSTTRGWGGIATAQAALNNYVGVDAYGYGYSYGASSVNNNSFVSYGATYTTGDVIGVAFDADAGTLTFYKNGTSQGTAFTGIPAGTYFPAFTCFAGGTISPNFGQQPFSYTPPTGFVALNTFNLPTPTIGATASTLAGKYFNPVLYTGNGGSQSVTGVGFQPDWVWVKVRSSTQNHSSNDSVRGAGNYLVQNATAAERFQGEFDSFDSDGFSLTYNAAEGDYNGSGKTYVAWNWRANQGTNVTNTAGSITSTVSANTTAGFSVVTYTGNGTSGATVGHSLGVAPSMVIVKRRNGVASWIVNHTSAGTGFLLLENTAAYSSATTYWTTAPTSSLLPTLTSNSEVNASGGTYVAYCFAQVAGYSAFGSYTGNGSSDGPFIYTGFKPAMIWTKPSSTTGPWNVLDNKRGPYNVNQPYLQQNTSSAEATVDYVDFLSNGFKIRYNAASPNANGDTILYVAFAENPFKYANAR